MSWLSDAWELAKTVVKLAGDLQEYRAELKEVRREVRDLAIAVARLEERISHSESTAESDRKLAESERQRFFTALENAMLKMERRLPPAKTDEKKRSECRTALRLMELS